MTYQAKYRKLVAIGSIAQSVELRTFNAEAAPATKRIERDSADVATGEADREPPSQGEQPPHAATADPVEEALLAELKVATSKRDLDAIRDVTRELRERRLERQGVVDLSAARKRGGR